MEIHRLRQFVKKTQRKEYEVKSQLYYFNEKKQSIELMQIKQLVYAQNKISAIKRAQNLTGQQLKMKTLSIKKVRG